MHLFWMVIEEMHNLYSNSVQWHVNPVWPFCWCRWWEQGFSRGCRVQLEHSCSSSEIFWFFSTEAFCLDFYVISANMALFNCSFNDALESNTEVSKSTNYSFVRRAALLIMSSKARLVRFTSSSRWVPMRWPEFCSLRISVVPNTWTAYWTELLMWFSL